MRSILHAVLRVSDDKSDHRINGGLEAWRNFFESEPKLQMRVGCRCRRVRSQGTLTAHSELHAATRPRAARSCQTNSKSVSRCWVMEKNRINEPLDPNKGHLAKRTLLETRNLGIDKNAALHRFTTSTDAVGSSKHTLGQHKRT